MFNFNLNWLKIIKENLPSDYVNQYIIDFIKVLISPINQIYQDFMLMYQVYVYKIRFNGQVDYLEQILNDKFSPVIGGIYITDGGNANPNYLYRKSESKPPYYIYRKWNSTITYAIGNFSVLNNKVYIATASNSNSSPVLLTNWAYHSDVKFIRKKSEFYFQFNFIVNVPSALVYNQTAMKAILNYYKLAGKQYKIITY